MKRTNKMLMMCMIAVVVMTSTGCFRSKVVPAGNIVVVRKSDGSAIVSAKGTYMAYGRDKAYFVDTRMASKSVMMEILCSDGVNMKVEVKWIGSFDVTTATAEAVLEMVPSVPVNTGDVSGYQLSLEQFWKTAMLDVVQGAAKKVVAPYNTDVINVNRDKIEADIKTAVLANLKAAGYPVNTSNVLVANLDFPVEVTNARKAIKTAELKDLENAAIAKANVSKAKRDAELALEINKAKVIDAEGDAEVNRIKSESLTPEILTLKWQEALMALASGPNNSSVIVPYEAIRPELLDTTLIKAAVDNPTPTNK